MKGVSLAAWHTRLSMNFGNRSGSPSSPPRKESFPSPLGRRWPGGPDEGDGARIVRKTSPSPYPRISGSVPFILFSMAGTAPTFHEMSDGAAAPPLGVTRAGQPEEWLKGASPETAVSSANGLPRGEGKAPERLQFFGLMDESHRLDNPSELSKIAADRHASARC